MKLISLRQYIIGVIRHVNILPALFILVPIVALSETELSHEEGVVKYISIYSNANEYCEQVARSRDLPDKEYFLDFPKLNNKMLYGFLVYKSEVAKWNCINDKSGYNSIILIHAIGQMNVSTQEGAITDTFLKLISSKNVLDAFMLYMEIPEETRDEFDKFSYFNLPFNYLEIGALMKDDVMVPPMDEPMISSETNVAIP